MRSRAEPVTVIVWSLFLVCVYAQAITIDDKTKATASAKPALKICPFPFLSVLIILLAPPNAAD
jgi:hypothetical protein